MNANGGPVNVTTFTPLTKNRTVAMPTLSCACAESATVRPANTCRGADRLIDGAVTSLSASGTTETTPLASPRLPLKSVAWTSTPRDDPAGASAGTGYAASNGGPGSVATTTPLTVNDTDCTPTLSLTVADNCSVMPPTAVGGALIATTGLSVSGTDPMMRARSALERLPAASRAVALTMIRSPGEATDGTLTTC